jgi:hypothetical protein
MQEILYMLRGELRIQDLMPLLLSTGPKKSSALYSDFKEANKNHPTPRAAKIAWEVTKTNYKHVGAHGKKSLAVPQTSMVTSEGKTYIDVLLGFADVNDRDIMLAPDVWKKPINGVLKGDVEHYYAKKAAGEFVDIPEELQDFIPMAQKFWNTEGKLYGRVELPENHSATPTFMNEWKSGKWGVSIEYIYPEEAVNYTWQDGVMVPYVSDATITGFTFTKNPAIKETKNGEKGIERQE